MTRPPIDLDTIYIETAFARRMRATLDEVMDRHTSHFVGALSGAGKSTLLDDYQASHPVERRRDGTTSAPVIVGTPANDGGRSAKGFCESFLRNFGLVPPGTEAAKTERLITQIVACDTRLIACDDTHVARPDDLLFLKRVIDGVRQRSGRLVPVALLCAATPGRLPLWEVVNRQTLEWTQFRRRLSPTDPWLFIASLSPDEVREVLRGYEREATVRAAVPDLRLERWWERIHRHLVHPFFPTDGGGDRVTMQNVRNLVGIVLDEVAARGFKDIPGDGRIIDAAAAAMIASPQTKQRVDDPGLAPALAGTPAEAAG